jgi:hypothetical protein
MRSVFRLAIFPVASLASATCLAGACGTPASAAIVISTAATSNMDCSNRLCEPTAKDAVLNVGDLTSMLAQGGVEISTGYSSLRKEVRDIDIDAGFSWSGSSGLTLAAYRSIVFENGAVAVNGPGPVALAASDGAKNGRLSFRPGASLSFASTNNSLTINGRAFTLENSIATLARAIAANPAGNFALANSYDASQERYGNSPIGATLEGEVEGLGNTISNLSISAGPQINQPYGGENIGLFSEIGENGTVSDLKLAELKYEILSRGCVAGGLAGANNGIVANAYVSGSIRDASITKGFVEFAGGLVGFNVNVITASHASVGIKSPGYATSGGLAARNSGVIELSSADGYVEAESEAEDLGGLVGENDGAITESFASGRVSSIESIAAGGLVGANFTAGEPYIANSYAMGSVKVDGYAEVGGFVGDGYFWEPPNSIVGSYSTGSVSKSQAGWVGGFIGGDESYGGASSAYWNTTTSGTTQGVGENDDQVAGLSGLTSKQLRSGLPEGFDPSIWREKKGVNRGFPYLINNPPAKD